MARRENNMLVTHDESMIDGPEGVYYSNYLNKFVLLTRKEFQLVQKDGEILSCYTYNVEMDGIDHGVSRLEKSTELEFIGELWKNLFAF